MTDKIAFLDQLPLFANLTEEEFAALAEIGEEYEFEAGAVLAYQRDVADKLYVVASGRLFAKSVDRQGIVRDSCAYEEGDHFGEEWLFSPHSHPATVKATESGQIIVFESTDFLDFLEKHPRVLQHLEPEYDEQDRQVAGLSPEAWDEAQKSQLAPAKKQPGARDLTQGELIEYATRRSIWLLALRTVPLLALMFGLAGLFLLFRPAASAFNSPALTAAVLVFLVAFFGGLIVYAWLDWRNDYFVITTGHLVHYEFNLSLTNFGTVVNKTPIDQVQSVEVEKPNLFSTLFNVGAVRVTTAAQAGVMRFDFIDDPAAVRDTLNQLQERVKELDAGREQGIMRQSIEDHFETDSALRELNPDGEDDPDKATSGESFWRGLVRRFGARVVEGNTITYRKHIFVLFYVCRWPLAVGLALLAATFVAVRLFQFRLVNLFPFLALASLADLGWLIWQIEDWRNDTFQVNKRYVIDIDRRPFGTGESRKQAELSNVQNISADRPGLLQTLFNYGNVFIETAGATADITFESVANPNQVQRDIFEHREAFRRQQQIRQGRRRRREYAVLLDVYKQATEQERIPRRTPED